MRLATLLATVLGALAWSLSRPDEIPFARHTIDLGASETCVFADLNGDGRLDIVSGENWYEAPKWHKHKFRTLNFAENYIDDFSDLAIDVDGDGRVDLITASWFNRRLAWWRNPGAAGAWVEHVITDQSPVEFAFLVDLDNDGKARELLPEFGSASAPLSWYAIKSGEFVPHVVSPHSYGHGIGAGDVNGDGRTDILTPKGWFEAPDWKFHPDWSLGDVGFMHVLDVNADGRADVLTSMAHDYGIFWLEQGADGRWTRHAIDESWSQAHALVMVDWGGGRHGLLTGKRYMAHNGRDPGEREPLGIYWYEALRDGARLEWARHVINYGGRAGGGIQIAVGDVDGDGDLDFAVGGKSGLFWFENLTRKR